MTETSSPVPSRGGRARAAVENAIRVVSLLVVIAYLATLFVYVLPWNPLQQQMWPWTRRVVGLFLDQRWAMFAPTPMSATDTLYARCHAAEWSSEWIDLTTRLNEDARRRPWSASLRLEGYLLAVIQQERGLAPKEKPDVSAEKRVEDEERARVQRADVNERWTRIGAIACGDAFPDRSIERTELKYRRRPSRPWAKRDEPPPPDEEHEIGAFPMRAGLVRPGIFGAEDRL